VLRLVGLEPEHARRFPHEFSGGQRIVETRPAQELCTDREPALTGDDRQQAACHHADAWPVPS
jgi:hypothetical protein